MGMLGNQSRRNFGTGYSAGSLYAVTPYARRNTGENVRFSAQDGAQTTLRLAAVPAGYNGSSAYNAPQTSGDMCTSYQGEGVLVAAPLAMSLGFNVTGSASALMEAGAALLNLLLPATGSASATATLDGAIAAISFLTGAAGAALVANNPLLAAILWATGTGSAAGSTSCNMTMIGHLHGDIVPYTELSPQSLSDAVWSAVAAANNAAGTMGEKINDAGSASNPWTEVIESGYTATEVLQILLAVAAGKTTITDLGGGNASVAFRDQADTVDRILAGMSGSERTSVTLNA